MFNLHLSDDGGLLDTALAETDSSRAAAWRNASIPAWLVYPITLVLSVWTFGYISGLFPYLGHYQRDESRTGLFSGGGNPIGTFSLPYAYLFKGQTIFIDYDVEQQGRVRMLIYLNHPHIPTFAPHPYTYATIEGSSAGRFLYVVPESGLYDIDPSVMGSLDGYHIKYNVTWGATWSNGLGSLPAAKGPVQQIPIAKDSNPARVLLPSLVT
jgi:hypothetical protein